MTRRGIWVAVSLLVGAAGMARAERRVTVRGVVRRADNRAPVADATVLIKETAMAGAEVLGRMVTGKDGTFAAEVTVARPRFVCEAVVKGMAPQRLSQSVDAPTCELELESELKLSEVVRRSPVNASGPALSFLASTESSLSLATLTIRLHLKKPDSCGAPTEPQQYKLDGTLEVSLGRMTGKIATGPNTFQITGTAPLRFCEKTEVSLIVEPAAKLEAGETPIVVVLPKSLTLKQGSARRSMSLAQLGASAAYRSTIEQIDVELVTSRGGKASATLQGIAIPVGVAP